MIAFAHRLEAFAARRLREGVARRVHRQSLAMARVLAALVVALILAGALAFRLIVIWGPAGDATKATAADPVVMFKNPPSANLWLCNSATANCAGEGEHQLIVNEEVANIPSNVHIGGFVFLVRYSRDMVSLTATEGPFLGSTGRDTRCWQSQSQNWLRFGCTSTGSDPGPTGSGILAYLTVTPNITFRPTSGNGVYVRLFDDFGTAELSDILGNPVLVEEVANSTILLRALEGDVNYDCRVNVIDEQSEAGRYGSTPGLATYQVQYDLNPSIPDSDIDIKDLQFVFGRAGSTCEKPIASQPAEISTPTPTPTLTPSRTPTATSGSPHPVGGIAEYPDVEPGPAASAHQSSGPGAAAGIATGALLLAAGGWYAMRRWRAS